MARERTFDEKHLAVIRYMVAELEYSDGYIARIMLTDRSNITRARSDMGLEANYRAGKRASKKVLALHELHQ